MTTSAVVKSTAKHNYASGFGQQLAESLESKLNPPWRLQYDVQALDVGASGWSMIYTPDIVLMNEIMGQVLALAIQNCISLSMPNMIKLQHIRSAFEKRGTDFLVVVYGDSSAVSEAQARLGVYGIRAIGAHRAIDAANEIKKLLAI